MNLEISAAFSAGRIHKDMFKSVNDSGFLWVQSKALPKLGRCVAGFKITPGKQTMSAQNDHYLDITGNYKNGPGPL